MPSTAPAAAGLRLLRHLPLAFLFVLAFLGCGDQLKSEKAPILKFSPEPPVFSFPKIRVGEASAGADQQVSLQNIGEGTLFLVDFAPDFNGEEFDLYYFIDEDADTQFEGVIGGENRLPARMEVDPGHSLTFVLSYHPTSDAQAAGALRFRTNDAKYGNAELEIISEERAPEITVAPTEIDFDRVAVGTTTDPRDVVVTNIGQEVLTIEDVRLSGVGFLVALGETDITGGAGDLLADPDGDGTPGLSPDRSFTLKVSFRSEVESPAEGVLAILSNDPESPTVNVSLEANGASPCIRVSPQGDDGLAFGGVPIDGRAERAITIESCGLQPLRIDSIAMSDDTAEAISLVEASVPQLPALMPAMTEGQPLPNRSIKLQCSPADASAYGGWIVVKSNDPARPEVKVKVTCLGVLNACPRPAVDNDEFRVAPLETILLDGGASVDDDGPGGKPVKYRWMVMGPAGSSARAVERIGPDPQAPYEGSTPDNEETPTARLFVDVVGTYTVQLYVEDNLGQVAPSENCPEPVATITIIAESDEDIHVEMSWTTPGDPNETDTAGSDVDLHMLHPRGQRWSSAPLDCYYANPSPDWGVQGDPSDNPALELDDINGAGPENITLDNPEDTEALGAPYRVGVDYYREESLQSFDGYGPSYVTVRIYLGGVLAWQNDAPKEMVRTHDFWEVAQIIWTENDRRVRVVDRLN
ncbi:choice-of-anchor D domain-containing protein [Myxococcota bacterium]|nr:choice-of-anchor D domain-containing protein [Myxococcota bacterium]